MPPEMIEIIEGHLKEEGLKKVKKKQRCTATVTLKKIQRAKLSGGIATHTRSGMQSKAESESGHTQAICC